MLSLNLQNIFAVGARHGLAKGELQSYAKNLKRHIAGVKSRGEQFYRVIDDATTLRQLQKFADRMRPRFSDIIVLGIGGSALGTISLQHALTHLYVETSPRLHVLDNVDPVMIHELADVIDYRKTLFLVVSKSGTNPEPLSQYLYFKRQIEKRHLAPQKHFVFITNPDGGFLRTVGEQEGITIFNHAPVGGRYSVLTSVGLLPAAFLKIHLTELLRGARAMRDRFLSPSFSQNFPYQVAAIQHALSAKGKSINVMMPYAQKLIRFADWYRQLLAESIGKAKDRNGKMVHCGITSVDALGTTDQHSQSQLYNEGPNDKLVLFLTVKKLAASLQIPDVYPKEKDVAFLRGATFQDLIVAEYEATAMSYTKNKRPNCTVTIDAVDAYHLGQLFMLFEGATAFLGELFNVNAFDQPGVELAKKFTKEFLLKRRR